MSQPRTGLHISRISSKSRSAEAIRYALTRWEGLTLFLDDGRVEIDNDTVERAIRPLALTRKNALFAGSDGGTDHWAVVASLIETCKLAGVEPGRTDLAVPALELALNPGLRDLSRDHRRRLRRLA